MKLQLGIRMAKYGVSLANPVRVSPTIKMARWSFLVVGYLWGSSRQKRLKRKEDERRAIEEAERPAKEAALKAEKERASRAELDYLASIGIPIGGSGGGGSGGKSSECEFKF